MTMYEHAKMAMKDKHTILCILAEELAKLGVSSVEVSIERLCDMDYRDTTVKIVHHAQRDSYVIYLNRRVHDSEYVDYEVVEDQKQINAGKKLLGSG